MGGRGRLVQLYLNPTHVHEQRPIQISLWTSWQHLPSCCPVRQSFALCATILDAEPASMACLPVSLTNPMTLTNPFATGPFRVLNNPRGYALVSGKYSTLYVQALA